MAWVLCDNSGLLSNRQFLHELQKRGLKGLEFLRLHVSTVEESFILVAFIIERRDHVGRDLAIERESDVLFLWLIPTDRDVVLRTSFRQKLFRQRSHDRLSQQEMSRIEARIEVWVGHLRVKHHEIVEHRRAAPPMAQDEDGRNVDLGLADLSGV